MKRILLTLATLLLPVLSWAEGCFVSGVTDQYTYFVAVDATDFTSRETGLTTFTVYRSRNGGAAAAFTTPTINETDQTNMPGAYELLLDEDMTLDAGDNMQHMLLHITHAGMAPVSKEICIERPAVTAGETLTVSSGVGDADVTLIESADATDTIDGRLTNIHLDHLFAATYDPASKPGVADALLNELIESDAGVSRFTANALEQGPSGGGALTDDDLGYWTTTINTVNSQTELVLTAGSADNGAYDGWGVILQDQSTTAQRSTRYASCTTPYVGSTLTLTLSSAADFTVVAGDTVILAPALACADGSQLSSIPGGGDFGSGNTLVGNLTDLEALVDDLETRLSAARAGYLDNLSAGAAALETTAQSILTDTAEIGAAGAGLTEAGGTGDQFTALATAAALTTVDGNVDDIEAALGAVPTEPSAVPTWGSATVAEWIGYIGAWFRNEVQQTATTKTLRNDADTGDLITCGVSDDGTTFQVDECL